MLVRFGFSRIKIFVLDIDILPGNTFRLISHVRDSGHYAGPSLTSKSNIVSTSKFSHFFKLEAENAADPNALKSLFFSVFCDTVTAGSFSCPHKKTTFIVSCVYWLWSLFTKQQQVENPGSLMYKPTLLSGHPPVLFKGPPQSTCHQELHHFTNWLG